MTVSVVLPTYNEKETIVQLVCEILAALCDHNAEVLVVDDDSPDRTWELVTEGFADDSRVRVIRRAGVRGLTSAIAEGIRQSRGEAIAWMDADFSHPPEVLPKLAEAVEANDVAVASRYAPGAADARMSRRRAMASALINGLAILLLRVSIRDYTSGFVMARRQVLERIPLRGDYGEYCIDFLFHAGRAGYRVCEVPFANAPRRAGKTKTDSSTVTFLLYGAVYVWTVLRLGCRRLCARS